ncbi:MAG: PP2C family protein-serine/threonine phosphatase [Phycisphaerales bacterium]|nr:PP2C family protein-serine/threonine phosphatase [Phycisphaerales bacterium]
MAQLLATAINNTRLEGKRLEQERVAGQLKMAADVQKRMLPQTLPMIANFEVAARYVPSFELGGDFYDFIDFQNSLGIAIADVSGKGVAASLLMAAVRSSLRAYAQDLYDLDMIISRVNQALCRDTQANEFATLLYGVLDPRTRRFTYSNAGHEPALLLRKGQIIRLEAGGMVVGVDPAQKFDKGILDFQKGDMVLFYTDGLMDAMNFERQRFGRDRIISAFKECTDKTAGEALNHVLWEMRRFAGMSPRTDDNTMIVLKCVS